MALARRRIQEQHKIHRCAGRAAFAHKLVHDPHRRHHAFSEHRFEIKLQLVPEGIVKQLTAHQFAFIGKIKAEIVRAPVIAEGITDDLRPLRIGQPRPQHGHVICVHRMFGTGEHHALAYSLEDHTGIPVLGLLMRLTRLGIQFAVLDTDRLQFLGRAHVQRAVRPKAGQERVG